MELIAGESRGKNVPEHIMIIQDKSYNLVTDINKLIDKIGDAKIVLLGEASHGTHEYYTLRAFITQQLIEKKGFNIIGVEGDWPDCYNINRFIRGYKSAGEKAADVLMKFNRWPSWMWANWEIAALLGWLKKYNSENTPQAGFYGLDVYSLWESLESILDYLLKHDAGAFEVAQKAIECFDPYQREGQEYAVSTRFTPQSCEKEVLDLLMEIRSRAPFFPDDHEAPFSTEQNAVTAVNAERYYRAMINGGPEAWNIRDRHMTETIERLLEYHGRASKAVIWAHNSHIGDARATTMVKSRTVNVGQLVREKWGAPASFSVGFGTWKGSVIAGSSWGAPMQKMVTPKARQGSWESMLHDASPADKFIFTDELKGYNLFDDYIIHRAIGVVYNPENEKYGNYVPSIIPDRYDAFVYLDDTKALHPMKINDNPETVPDTYPFGI